MSPDGSTKPPPEEKLLKLIRGKGPRSAGTSASGRSGTTPSATLRVAMSGLRGPALELRWLKLIAIGLGVVLAIEAAAFIIQLTRPLATVQAPAVVEPPTDEHSTIPPEAVLSQIPSVSASAVRPLFTVPAEVVSSTPTPSATSSRSAPSASASLLASRLTLMGIMAGNPAQAIIEDTQTKKTYFVSPGQAVADGAILEQVLDNRVILDLAGEKIELTL